MKKLLKELGFTLETYSNGELLPDGEFWEKEYETKLGNLRLIVDYQNCDKTVPQIVWYCSEDWEHPLCDYTRSNIYFWDEYFTKMKEL